MVNNDSSVLTSDRKVARRRLYSGYPVKIHPPCLRMALYASSSCYHSEGCRLGER